MDLRTLSADINKAYASKNKDEYTFWRLVESYVRIVGRNYIDSTYLPDLVQNILVEVHKSLGRFKPLPANKVGDHNTSFTRWLHTITYNHVMNLRRHEGTVGVKEVQLSSLGYWDEDEVWAPLDVADPRTTDGDSEDDLQDKEDEVARRLDNFRELLDNKKDRKLFDALRKDYDLAKAGSLIGVSTSVARGLVSRTWRTLARKHSDAV